MPIRFHLASLLFLFSFLCLETRAASGITGYVSDKLDNPIPAAKACLKSAPSQCVTGDENGYFEITPGSGILKPRDQAPFRAFLDNGRVSVTSGLPMRLTREWFDARGRRMQKGILNLPGDGKAAETAPPAGAAEGIYHLRLSGGGLQASYSVAFLGGAVSVRPSAPPTSGLLAAGLAKVAASDRDLVISKAGYQTQNYAFDPDDTDGVAYITLSTVEDTTDKIVTHIRTGASIDRTAKILITTEKHVDCNDSAAVLTVTHDTTDYTIGNGRLWLRDFNACGGIAYTGTATDIAGSWLWEKEYASMPPEYRSQDCAPDSEDTDGGDADLAGALTYIITDSTVQGDWQRDYCSGDDFSWLSSLASSSDSGMYLTGNTCHRITYANDNGDSAVLVLTNAGDSTLADFTFGTSTCHMGTSHTVSLDVEEPAPSKRLRPIGS